MMKKLVLILLSVFVALGPLVKGSEAQTSEILDALYDLNVKGDFTYPDIGFSKEDVNYTVITIVVLNDEDKPVGLADHRQEHANASLVSRYFHRDLFFKEIVDHRPEALSESVKVQAFAMGDHGEIVLFSNVVNLSLMDPEAFTLKFELANTLSLDEDLILKARHDEAKKLAQREFTIAVELDIDPVIYAALPKKATLFMVARDKAAGAELARYSWDQFKRDDYKRVTFTDHHLGHQGQSIADYPEISVEVFISSTDSIEDKIALVKGDVLLITPDARNQYILLETGY